MALTDAMLCPHCYFHWRCTACGHRWTWIAGHTYQWHCDGAHKERLGFARCCMEHLHSRELGGYYCKHCGYDGRTLRR